MAKIGVKEEIEQSAYYTEAHQMTIRCINDAADFKEMEELFAQQLCLWMESSAQHERAARSWKKMWEGLADDV